MPTPPDELWPKLEAAGETKVRKNMAIDAYGKDRDGVQAWLDMKDREREENREASAAGDRRSELEISRSVKNAAWIAIVISILSLAVSLYAVILSSRTK